MQARFCFFRRLDCGSICVEIHQLCTSGDAISFTHIPKAPAIELQPVQSMTKIFISFLILTIQTIQTFESFPPAGCDCGRPP